MFLFVLQVLEGFIQSVWPRFAPPSVCTRVPSGCEGGNSEARRSSGHLWAGRDHSLTDCFWTTKKLQMPWLLWHRVHVDVFSFAEWTFCFYSVLQKLAALAKEPLKGLGVKKHVPVYISLANIPQDYNGGFFGTGPKVLGLFGDPPKSSDQESGEVLFKCHSWSNGSAFSNNDGFKDTDSQNCLQCCLEVEQVENKKPYIKNAST